MMQTGGGYALSQEVAATLDRAHATGEALMGAAAGEVAILPSTTAAASVLARALRPLWRPGDVVVISELDHEANIGPWTALAATGIEIRQWRMRPETGELALEDLEAILDPRVRLVAMTHCANVIGRIHDVAAVAERVRLESFLIFSTLFVALIYPIAGMWQWGGGWLAVRGFHDFAGSTIVHGVGGWGALAGVIVLGPRVGKYREVPVRDEQGLHRVTRIVPVRPHSLPLATVGMFLLWFGWFGFNGGSVLSAEPGAISRVLVMTCIAGAGGIVTAVASSWLVQGKPDLSMGLNGALAGLVAVTAGADLLAVGQALLVGAAAGTLVVFAVMLFDRLRLDDPVGAISVHLVCGVWGTLAVAMFSAEVDFVVQLVGVASVAALSFPSAYMLMKLLDRLLGMRVGEEEERRGLDLEEHGMQAYCGGGPS
ncbi:MAG: aminotransferase class V-fold PLP-dependent enzyme [Myxococcales bacterium]|nr:aminotransferase class V-fold PLP-dependent enzyme [Myxococcales bacterium]